MRTPAIEFRNINKSFVSWRDRPHSIKTILAQLMSLSFKMGERKLAPVLENIDLTIYRGEFVGLMGRNGAGKSTLLKLISGIYQPTAGEIRTYGRIAPLLELGAGFADELTGYENIFLNGSILGFNRAQIHKHLNSIMEFSELKDDLYKPVRNYSSGMLVRLGFSIAAHLDAEILLFDEILAVGDVGFQEKCLKKITELHSSGKTIVLVTHSPEQVLQFCSRCVVFERHGIIYDGAPKTGVEVYSNIFRHEEAGNCINA